jgi:hypothetical protein
LLKLRVLNPVMDHLVSKALAVKVAKVFLTVGLLPQALLGKRLALLQAAAAAVLLLLKTSPYYGLAGKLQVTGRLRTSLMLDPTIKFPAILWLWV